MRWIATLLVWSLTLNLTLGVLGRGSFLHQFFIFGCYLFVFVPAAILFLAEEENRLRRPSRNLGPSLPSLRVAIVSASTIISMPIGSWLNDRDIQEAKSYCEALIPALEEYQQQHGIYPETLDPIPQPRPLPRLLRGEGQFYRGGPNGYHFSFFNPAGMFNGIESNGSSREWTEWD